ncbi:hypothetical protein Tco_0425682 [Tanacetum coccineum]
MPSFSSPEPMVSYFDDLDFLNDFEKEFPTIVYNDALTSKSDSSTEPVEYPQHIDEFNLKTQTSLFECDEKEQNVLYFNDLFPFNIIYPQDLESDKDIDDNEIDRIQSTGGNINTQRSNKPLKKVTIKSVKFSLWKILSRNWMLISWLGVIVGIKRLLDDLGVTVA